ncbi:hypothetical protein [Nannocystis bainbridge]|uniref:Uncharacterized protein n=1 Tax=Nannocystis bainbridge TaxID=2995303 RepID=A0ABT5E474_9BACT|nr:hypothetical protein [Nannocystis bainbridge]MDC0720671.1 hypothetical protein [Nannocystis bainbridge]
MTPIVIGGLLLFLLFGGQKKAGNTVKPDPGFAPRPELETLACADVLATRPEVHAGLARGLIPWRDWLVAVAFNRVYGVWPDPGNAAHDARAKLLGTCVDAGLDDAPPPPNSDPELPEISPAPTPGSFYAIKGGDVLFAISSAAYGTKSGTPANYQAAKKINDDPYNARFKRPIAEVAPNEKGLWSARITFKPVFGSFLQQYADAADGSQGDGGNFAILKIPE